MSEFLPQIIQATVAAIPGVAITISSAMGSLSKIKKKTSEFTPAINETKVEISDMISKNTAVVKEELSSYKKEVSTMLEKSAEEMASKVNDELVGMKKELSNYEQELRATKENQQTLLLQNQAYFSIISQIAAKDPKVVHDGVSKIINDNFGDLKQQMIGKTILVKEDVNALRTALVKAKTLMTEEEYKSLLLKVENDTNI